MSTAPILRIDDLSVSFRRDDGSVVRAVRGVTLDLYPGETLGVVGESGCGKTVTALSTMRLLQTPPARIDGGLILFRGRDLLALSDAEMRSVRGREISMVFQEPMTSLNPVFTVGDQVAEVFTAHGLCGRSEAKRRAVEVLEKVGIPDAARRADDYPHALSGGLRQRVMIAMALALEPAVLIADEPTTALDVTIQAQILDLLKELQRQKGTSILLITHDLGVVATFATRVAIMYLGRVVETAATADLFAAPLHPYTVGLLAAIPGIHAPKTALAAIPGSVPDLADIPPGCPFADRCPVRAAARDGHASGRATHDALAVCDTVDPPLVPHAPGHAVACHAVATSKKGDTR